MFRAVFTLFILSFLATSNVYGAVDLNAGLDLGAKPQKTAKDTLSPKCKKLEEKEKTRCKKKYINRKKTDKKNSRLQACLKKAKFKAVEYGDDEEKLINKSTSCKSKSEIEKKYGKACFRKCKKGVNILSKNLVGDKFSEGLICQSNLDGGKIAVCREDKEYAKNLNSRIQKEGTLGSSYKMLSGVLGPQQGERNDKGAEKRRYTYEEAMKHIGKSETGLASRYGTDSSSGLTASGAQLKNGLYSMASLDYPDGTVGILKRGNNEIPIVVNNTGGFEKYGRGYDLSYAAADALGISKKMGVGRVTFTPTYVPPYSTYKPNRTDYVAGFAPSKAPYYLRKFKESLGGYYSPFEYTGYPGVIRF